MYKIKIYLMNKNYKLTEIIFLINILNNNNYKLITFNI